MYTPAGRRGNLLIVAILLLICILLEQYWIVRFFPWVGDLGGFRPMFVFLDIPLPLPKIDWLPVSILFVFLYSIVVAPGAFRGGRPGAQLLRKKVWNALTAWWLLLLCTAAGGGLYYLVQDYLTKQVGNGIDSFGVRTDITLPWPSGDLIHLHGSMLQLVFFGIGLHIMAKRISTIQQVAASTAGKTQPVIPSRPPVERPAVVKESVPAPRPAPVSRPAIPPSVTVLMPRPAPGPGKIHPCVVTGVLEPSKT